MSRVVWFAKVVFRSFFTLPIAFVIGILSLAYLVITKDIPLFIMPQRMAAALDSFPIMAIPLYILVGKIMNVGGITDRLFRFAKALVGHFKGGLAHVNVVLSMIFSGMSGAALADAAGLGNIEIKAMVDEGFPADFSAAVTAATSTIGPIIPPSIPFVLYGALAETSIGQLFAAGAIPGLLMGISMMVLIGLLSHKRNYPVSRKATIREFITTLINAIPPLITIVIILGGIMGGIFTPTEAAGIAVLYGLILSIIYKEMTLKLFWESIIDTGITTGTILFIFSFAAVFGWLITLEQIPDVIANFLLTYIDSKIIFLLLINIFLLFLGMFMDIMSIIAIVVPIFVPLASQFGIDPVHFGVIVIFNLMLGGLTPPFAMLVFVVSNISKVSFKDVLRQTYPFYVPLLIVLLAITFIPSLSLYLPTQLFR